MSTGRVPIGICPKCRKVHRHGEWLPYEYMREYLENHSSEWVQVREVCPECRKFLIQNTGKKV